MQSVIHPDHYCNNTCRLHQHSTLKTACCSLTFQKIADALGNFLQICFQWRIKKKNIIFLTFCPHDVFDPKLSGGNISRFGLFMDLFFFRENEDVFKELDVIWELHLLCHYCLSLCSFVVLPSTHSNMMQLKSIWVCACVRVYLLWGQICVSNVKACI